MRGVATIAAKEITDSVRNRWAIAATVLMTAMALALVFLGAAPVGAVSVDPLVVTVVSLTNLSIYFVPLIALLIAFDAVVGEAERGTLRLLLACPVSRMEILAGKALGQIAVLTLALTIGYGIAGLCVAGLSADWSLEGWAAFATLIGSSALLGATFVSLGILASTLAGERGTAASMAVGIWLVLVILFDVALLALLVADGGQVFSQTTVALTLLANPADIFRLINMVAIEEVGVAGGMAGLGQTLPIGTGVLLLAGLGWLLAPLSLAALAFHRKEM